ncbi:signal peptidase II [Pararhodospirillum photometricum]
MNNDGPWNAWILSGLAAGITVFLLVWLRRAETSLQVFALGLVIGGALGNVIDRVLYGAVVDFLDVHGFGYHWPAFNLADAAISTGAALLIGEALLRRDVGPRRSAGD